jgi:hypothetical protein
MEERGEEVLGLTQRLALHRTQTLHSLHQGRELLAGAGAAEAAEPWFLNRPNGQKAV